MNSNSKKNAADLDIALVKLLNLDANKKSHELAKLLGVAPSTVRHRLGKLLNSGAIRIIAVPRPGFIGYDGWAMLGLSIEPKSHDDVISALAQLEPVYTVASSFGRFDAIALVQLSSTDEIRAFVSNAVSTITGIRIVETFILASPKKYHGIIWDDNDDNLVLGDND